MLSWTKKRTDKNSFTRRCIGESIVYLLQDRELNKITVTDIARRAGISRMTFYHYYSSPTAALEDYLQEIVSQYVEERRKTGADGRLRIYSDVLFALNFFDRYAVFLLTLVHSGLYSIVIEAANHFMQEQFKEQKGEELYELYYYAGALLNVFIKWEEDKKAVPAEQIARIVAKGEESLQQGGKSF